MDFAFGQVGFQPTFPDEQAKHLKNINYLCTVTGFSSRQIKFGVTCLEEHFGEHFLSYLFNKCP